MNRLPPWLTTMHSSSAWRELLFSLSRLLALVLIFEIWWSESPLGHRWGFTFLNLTIFYSRRIGRSLSGFYWACSLFVGFVGDLWWLFCYITRQVQESDDEGSDTYSPWAAYSEEQSTYSFGTTIFHGLCIASSYILSPVNHMPNLKKIILIHLQHLVSTKKIHNIVTIL